MKFIVCDDIGPVTFSIMTKFSVMNITGVSSCINFTVLHTWFQT